MWTHGGHGSAAGGAERRTSRASSSTTATSTMATDNGHGIDGGNVSLRQEHQQTSRECGSG
jgi:hypothetical protein